MVTFIIFAKTDGYPIPGPPFPEQALPPPYDLNHALEQLIDLCIAYLDVKLKIPQLPLAGHHVVNPVVEHAYLHSLNYLAREYHLYHLPILGVQCSQVPAALEEPLGCLVSVEGEAEDLQDQVLVVDSTQTVGWPEGFHYYY